MPWEALWFQAVFWGAAGLWLAVVLPADEQLSRIYKGSRASVTASQHLLGEMRQNQDSEASAGPGDLTAVSSPGAFTAAH